MDNRKGTSMRIAKCVGDLHLHLMGNQASVTIGLGWHGDLDQVIGLTTRGPMTVADAIGHNLTPENFTIEPSPSKKGPAPAAKPQQE